ncbi:9972_t:CDS:2, partial [Racocetra persica]
FKANRKFSEAYRLTDVNQEAKNSIAFALHNTYVRNSALYYLELILFKQEASLKNFPNMPISELLTQQPLQYLKQKAIFDTIVLAIEREEEMILYKAEESNIIKLSNDLVHPSQNLLDLIKFIYSDVTIYANNPCYFVKHKILAPKNVDVDLVNKIVIELCLSEAYEYLSADAIDKTTE